MKLPFTFSFLSVALFPVLSFSQQYPDISGTYYQNGNSAQIAYVIQNGKNITFQLGQSTSVGYFYTASQVYASTWNTYATISADLNTLTWTNQTWNRVPLSPPNISGNWYQSNNTSYPVTITQNGKNLEFRTSNGSSKGYFYTNDRIYAIEWNTYATYEASTRSIKWNNQTWTAATTQQPTTNTGTTKACRKELSVFFYAMDALGTTWVRPIFEPGMMAARTISDLQAAFSAADAGLSLFPCINFDRSRITRLSGSLNSLTGAQASKESEKIILDVQLAIRNAAISCSNGMSIEQLFIMGIHLGAAQAYASSRLCQPVPMPANIQSVITSHLQTARAAAATLTACMPDLNLNIFNNVPLASMNSTEPHTFIVGIITQTLWAVTLTDCCCTCQGTAAQGTSCNDACQAWCKQHGYANGQYTGICLLGVTSGSVGQSDCKCW
jgi:hypothetical protein